VSLTRTQRFRLKEAIVDQMNAAHLEWNLQRKNLLLSEFDLQLPTGDSWNDPSFEETIADISDTDLLEMHHIVTGVRPDQVQGSIDAADPGRWKPGYVRLFISHSSRHREYVGKVSDELAVVGIDGFVAHNTMEYNRPWQAQIEQALKTMDAFVIFAHPEVNESPWCQQEVGWALSRRVPKYVVRMGADPAGFLGIAQWPSATFESHGQVAAIIREWLATELDLGEKIVRGLFEALENANNYVDAGAASERIASLGDLSEAHWAELNRIYWENDQLHGGALATRQLRPFYQGNDREWPPLKPDPAQHGA
jgi:hypothetical protein